MPTEPGMAQLPSTLPRDAGANACRICGGPTEVWRRGFYDDRYGFSGRFAMRRCARCSHRQLDAAFSAEELSQLYTNYYPRRHLSADEFQPYPPARGWQSWLNGERCSAYHWVPPGVRVLDIGCGSCGTLGYHQVRGCEVYGVEADENVRPIADRMGFNVHIGLFDPDAYAPEYFDVVTMDQVIEHFADPVAALCGVARVLRSGGRAILSTPNPDGWGARVFGGRWINWHVPYHLHQFSRASLRMAAEGAGLRLGRLLTLTHSEWLNYQWLHLENLPAEGRASAFWAPGAPNAAADRPAIPDYTLLMRKYRVNHVLTRLMDALGLGDSFLAFLTKP